MSYHLGIDVGTTYTAAATLTEGHARMATLGLRAPEMPSVVAVRDDGELVFGEAAERRALVEPERVAREFKRRVGDTTPIILAGSPYSTEVLTARLLNHVVDAVTAAEGGTPVSVVVTHPANWGPFRLELFAQAIELAGLSGTGTLPAAETLSEPQAAAVHYASLTRVEPGSVIAVYDLGGGTFDAAVLGKHRDGFAMIGESGGIERLGGADFDAAVMAHLIRSLDLDVSELDDDPATRAAMARLRAECVAAKEVLSADTVATIPVQIPRHNTEVRITRAEFEEMVRPSLATSVEALQGTIEKAGVDVADIDAVLLVGGSSRIPLVAQMVGSALGRPVQVDAHPKHSVALGAAIQAAQSESTVDAREAAAPTSLPAPPPPPEPPPPPPGPEPTRPRPPGSPVPSDLPVPPPSSRHPVPATASPEPAVAASDVPPDESMPTLPPTGAPDRPRRGWVAAAVIAIVVVGGSAVAVGSTLLDEPSQPTSTGRSQPVDDDDGNDTTSSSTTPESTTTTSGPTTTLPAPAPWEGPSVPVADADPALVISWLAADNRPTCSALHLDESADGTSGAHASVVEGINGWGVVWDLPDQRWAFGVSGVGSPNEVNDPDLMPNQRSWTDGSRAGYGPDGPEYHAELVIPGEDCYYAVWSSLGLEHLEWMLDNLHRVEGMSTGDPSWGLSPIDTDAVSPALVDAWNAAENRDTCAALHPDHLGVEGGTTSRTREFSGGWGVSWILPDGLRAFGVAGTGVDARMGDIDFWQKRIDWSDGSAAGYGPNGLDAEPDEVLAYLVLPTQGCLYNVWSDLGEAHLVHLLSHLRLVNGLATGG